MKAFIHLFGFAVIIATLAGGVRARGDESDDLLRQVTAVATQKADPATAAQVEQFTKENQTAIREILGNYLSYVNQSKNLLDDEEPDARPSVTLQPRTEVEAATAAAESPSALPTFRLQTAGKLEGAHLAGYPALPDVPPTSSILFPTAAQLAHKAEMDEKIRQRKLFLMKNPSHQE